MQPAISVSVEKIKTDFITTSLWRRCTVLLWLSMPGKVEEEKVFLSRADQTRTQSVLSWSIMLDSWVGSRSVSDLTRNIRIRSGASFLSKWVAYPVLENWHWSNKISPWCLIISSFIFIETSCKNTFLFVWNEKQDKWEQLISRNLQQLPAKILLSLFETESRINEKS